MPNWVEPLGATLIWLVVWSVIRQHCRIPNYTPVLRTIEPSVILKHTPTSRSEGKRAELATELTPTVTETDVVNVHFVLFHNVSKKKSQRLYFCAVESSVRNFRGKGHVVVWTANTTDIKEHLGQTPFFHSVDIRYLDFPLLFRDTPLQPWYESGTYLKSKWVGNNLNNAARLAVVYKYGGIYLDADILPLNGRLVELRKPAFAYQSPNYFNGAYLSFPKKHAMVRHFMENFVQKFNGNVWGNNGPSVITRTHKTHCRGSKRQSYCSGLELVATSRVYPIPWNQAKWIMAVVKANDQSLEKIWKNSWALHWWNKMFYKKDACVPVNSRFERIMHRTCPDTLERHGHFVHCK